MSRLVALINPLPLLRALKYSSRGITFAIKNERAFQQEVVLLVAGVIAAFLLADRGLERAVLIGSVGIVLVVELINSAIEATIDRIGPEQHPLSQRAKDLGSAAVFVSLVVAAGVWVLVLV